MFYNKYNNDKLNNKNIINNASSVFIIVSKQQTANSKQQTANSKQQTANSKQQWIWNI